MLDRMRRSVEVQQRFIADASHQLRTRSPDSRPRLTSPCRKPTRSAAMPCSSDRGGVDRASRLVNQLLTLARTEGTEIGQKRQEPVDLAELVRDLAADSVFRALERNIDLGVEAAEAAMVLGNPVMLRELVANLVDNALRYTPAPGRVTCRVIRQGNRIILEIEDNGVGISEDDAELVFERFYRVDDLGHRGERASPLPSCGRLHCSTMPRRACGPIPTGWGRWPRSSSRPSRRRNLRSSG